MRILINAVSAKMGGALRHLNNFVSALTRQQSRDEYLICVNKSVNLPQSNNVKIIRTNANDNFLRRLWWDQVEIPGIAKREKVDVIVAILNFGTFFPPVKQICFQRNSLYFSGHYLSIVSPFEKKKMEIKRWLTYRTMQASSVIVTPTYAARDMIRKFYPDIPETSFKIIPHGIDIDKFTGNSQPLPDGCVNALSNTPAGFTKLLYPTHPAPHKGYEVLFKATKILKDKGIKIVLFLTIQREDWPAVVDSYTKLIKKLKIEDEVVYLGRIPQNSIYNLYKSCDIFVFPSLCETFGFPMVETMSAGLPAVAADTAVNREILDSNALYYDGLDHHQCAEKLATLISDSTLRDRLIDGGKKRIQSLEWGWDNYVKKFNEII